MHSLSQTDTRLHLIFCIIRHMLPSDQLIDSVDIGFRVRCERDHLTSPIYITGLRKGEVHVDTDSRPGRDHLIAGQTRDT